MRRFVRYAPNARCHTASVPAIHPPHSPMTTQPSPRDGTKPKKVSPAPWEASVSGVMRASIGRRLGGLAGQQAGWVGGGQGGQGGKGT